MKPCYFLFLCAPIGLLAGAARAQSAPPAVFRVSLAPQPAPAPAPGWQVVRVLDARADHRLGQVRTGLQNQLGPAALARPLPTELLDYLDRTPAPAGARPVVLRVLALAVGEDLQAASEASEAELLADWLEPLPDSTYRVLLPVGETTRRKGLDVTRQHAENLASLLQAALRQLAARPAAAPASAPEVLSAADARAGRGGAAAPRWPVQAAGPAPYAIYCSFAEFRDHAPTGTTRPFEVKLPENPSKREQATGQVVARFLGAGTTATIRNAWGLSDGKRDYIYYRGDFYPLQPGPANTYSFQAPPPYDPEKGATGAVVGGLVGGLAGAAVGSALAGAGGGVIPYELHLGSGRVVPTRPFDDAPVAADTAVLYVLGRPGKTPAQPWRVQLDGREVGPLQPGRYLRLTWLENKPRPLCVQPEGGQVLCEPVAPDYAQPQYLEVSPGATPGTLRLETRTAQNGQWQIKRLGLKPMSERSE